jgi:flagellar hook-associated protein 2
MPDAYFTGLSTGIDWESTIQQLLAVESRPITVLENRRATLESQLTRWSSIQGQLQSLQSAVQALDTIPEFAAKLATSSHSSIVGATASASANPGSYDIVVQQLARSHKIASQGWADSSTTPVGDSGGDLVLTIGSNTITISDADIDDTTTLAELAGLINRDDDNDNLISATILNDGSASNPYRLVLTSVQTGEANAISVTSNPTSLDFTNTSIDSAEESSSWRGTSHVAIGAGANYTGTDNKTFSFTVGGTSGTHYAVGSSDITINWTDSAGGSGSFVIPAGYGGEEITVAEGVSLTFDVGSGEDLVAGDAWDVDVYNPTLQAAQDAHIRVDGIYMSQSSNTITDVIQGLTLDLLSADSGTTVTVTVSNDTETVESQISDFVSAYNALMASISAATSYDEESKTASPLLGDSTVSSIRGTLQSIISSMVPGLPSGAELSSLAEIGITTGSGGMLSLNTSDLQEALATDFDGVVDLFTESASSSSSSVFYQSRGSATQAGTYAVEVTYDEVGNITAATINGHSATIDGMFIVGADGTAEEGLRLGFDAPGGGAGTVSASVRLGLGAFASLGNQLTDINDPLEGQVHYAMDSLNTRIESLNDRIDSMEERLSQREEMYRRQFNNLEVALSQLQTQSQYLSSILG